MVLTSMHEETELVAVEFTTSLDTYVHVAVLFATWTVELPLEYFLKNDLYLVPVAVLYFLYYILPKWLVSAFLHITWINLLSYYVIC